MEYPTDLHYIFEKRIDVLCEELELIECAEKAETFLDSRVEAFKLSKQGEETYKTEKFLPNPKSVSNAYIFDSISETLRPITGAKLQDSEQAITLSIENKFFEKENEKFTDIITRNPSKFVSYASKETKIFDVNASILETKNLADSISVYLEKGKIKFEHKNKEMLKSFLNADAEEKKSIKDKMFRYLQAKDTTLNLDRVQISTRQEKSFEMDAVFGNIPIIDTLIECDKKNIYKVDTSNLDCPGFSFAGITKAGRPLIFKYNEMESFGYNIPLEEVDYSPESYNQIHKAMYDFYKKSFTNIKEFKRNAEMILKLSLNDKKEEIVKSILAMDIDSNAKLKRAEILYPLVKGNQKSLNIVKKHILELIKSELYEDKISEDDFIKHMKTYDLQKEQSFKILADQNPNSEYLINSLLAIDNDLTIKVFKLKEQYNNLLGQGKLHSIFHENNLFADFLRYEKQYNVLQDLGLKNYYEYNFPKDSEGGVKFMKQVNKLKDIFNKIKKDLNESIKKGALNFFERAREDYDHYAGFSEKELIKLGDNLREAIKSEALNEDKKDYRSKTGLISYAIRVKYYTYLKEAEAKKDSKTNNAETERKGRDLINYALEPQKANTAYRHWRNLNQLVHTEEDNELWKAKAGRRRQVLTEALDFYEKNLAVK